MNTKHRTNRGATEQAHRTTGSTYLAAIAEACPPETWREIVEATIVHAKQGDRAAREWLAN